MPKLALMSAGLVCALTVCPLAWADSGASVAVVFNSQVPGSKELADYYARQRQVPPEQVFGFELTAGEEMRRHEFQQQLQAPLWERLKDRMELTNAAATNGIRYLVLCYGVPVKIASDDQLKESGSEKMRVELRRNEAAVDSELAVLPRFASNPPLYGPLANSQYGTTNRGGLHPANGVLMVSRLDGPSLEIARGLVDKALSAETNGLWGRAYVDSRGITEGGHRIGDEWMRSSAVFMRRAGFDTILDIEPAVFSPSFPMSQIALYAGWYETHVAGALERPVVEFMPGAIAYHLHSYSAQTIRSAQAHWVGPLLSKGAAATMGCVNEPYLEASPDLSVFFSRLLFLGFTFGEAAYASQNVLSWQTTVVGDPLYRPFSRAGRDLHEDLDRRQSPLIEWSHLKVVNLNLVTDMAPPALIAYLRNVPELANSAILQEKMAELCFQDARFPDAIKAYRRALELNPTPQQKVRLTLDLGRTLDLYDEDEEAVALYEKFTLDYPDYREMPMIYRKLMKLGADLGRRDLIDKYEQALASASGNGK